MRDFYATFAQKYRHQPHPMFRKAHPDGWVRITAPTLESARELACRRFGTEWVGLYWQPEFSDDKHLYPLGELGHMQTSPQQ